MSNYRSYCWVQFAIALFLPGIIGIFTAGCQSRNPGTPGVFGLPPENQVRIVSRTLEKTSAKRHWKWSLIGERNWKIFSNREGRISLEKTSPLNDPDMKGSSNVWEADLIIEKSNSGVSWQTKLHGSNGATATDSGTESTTLDEIQIKLDKDTVTDLPADLALAQAGQRQIKWHIDR